MRLTNILMYIMIPITSLPFFCAHDGTALELFGMVDDLFCLLANQLYNLDADFAITYTPHFGVMVPYHTIPYPSGMVVASNNQRV